VAGGRYESDAHCQWITSMQQANLAVFTAVCHCNFLLGCAYVTQREWGPAYNMLTPKLVQSVADDISIWMLPPALIRSQGSLENVTYAATSDHGHERECSRARTYVHGHIGTVAAYDLAHATHASMNLGVKQGAPCGQRSPTFDNVRGCLRMPLTMLR
jgi:hypothetical protein